MREGVRAILALAPAQGLTWSEIWLRLRAGRRACATSSVLYALNQLEALGEAKRIRIARVSHWQPVRGGAGAG